MTVARKMASLLGLILLAGVVFGCRKQNTPASDSVSPPAHVAPMETILRLHWLGKKNISADTNAAKLMSIWSTPESTKLESQTLDKLAAAPWVLLRDETNSSSTNLLRPILDDLVTNETYVEIRRASDSPNIADEMVLAVRLDNARASLWETNLTTAFESLTGILPTNSPSIHGWTLAKHHAPNLIQLARVDDWTILGAGSDSNALFGETLTNISGHAGFLASATNAWLQGSGDLAGIFAGLGVNPGFRTNLPQFSLAVVGDGENVLTRGEFTLPSTVSMQLKPWQIPTNLIDGDLVSFTAVRGLKPWLSSCKTLTDLRVSSPANELFLWSSRGFPMQTYFAAPWVDASNEVSHLSDALLEKTRDSVPTNLFAGFRRSTTFNGLSERGLPYVEPFLRSIDVDGQSFVFGGGLPMEIASLPPPAELLKELTNRTNVVYRDWEMTSRRMSQWVYLLQFGRVVLTKAQLPPDSAGLTWLRTSAANLGDTTTEITQTTSTQLSFTRKSTVGFTAVELNVLADWLESPDFPVGLHTLSAKPAVQSSPETEK